MVNSFPDVITKFGGPTAFGEAIGMAANTAKQARTRKSIAAKWFIPIADAARERGLDDITVERLAQLAQERAA